MESRYRKLRCPVGHYSKIFKEEEPLPRRCHICSRQYLKNEKPVWCDENGIEIVETERAVSQDPIFQAKGGKPEKNNTFTEVGIKQEDIIKRRKRVSFLEDNYQEEKDGNTHAETIDKLNNHVTSYQLKSGDYYIQLVGEGILGREKTGKEYLAIDQYVSRSHCYYIVTEQNGLQIRDAGSMMLVT